MSDRQRAVSGDVWSDLLQILVSVLLFCVVCCVRVPCCALFSFR